MFNLALKGKGRNTTSKVKLKYKKESGYWALSVKSKKGAFGSEWADEGIRNETRLNAKVFLRCRVEVGQYVALRDASFTYLAKAGKSGKLQ